VTRTLASFLLVVLFVVLPVFVAKAEGRCPPGQYPVGGQGVLGCAPIPGYESQGMQQPAGHWQSRWGAIAYSDSTQAAGAAVDKLEQEAAKQTAMTQCQREGAADCRIIMSYENQCAVMVSPRTQVAGALGGLGNGITLEAALAQANSKCMDPAGDGCEAVYIHCLTPEFVQ